MIKALTQSLSAILLVLYPLLLNGQSKLAKDIDQNFKDILLQHKEFVSIPNLPAQEQIMLQNIHWVADRYRELGFEASMLETSSLPILLVQKEFNPRYKTILFYFHIDGQPVNPEAWDQEDPFTPVLKEKGPQGIWQTLDWDQLNGPINDEWRIFARAAADDKAPITMMLSALQALNRNNQNPKANIKIIFDPQEEYGSQALLATLDQYKHRYASDYFIVMDGPAHNSNQPTLTFGCRGIASCSITTYGSKLPQHSGHYGNYVPNPVFRLSHLLSSMKDEQGKVLIEDYYKGIEIDQTTGALLKSVPFDRASLDAELGIQSSEQVGEYYQESLQYPSLNVRQIGTSWKGPGLKTVIPEYATAYLDIRLVPETDGAEQLEKIKNHIQRQGYYTIDREPTDEERLTHDKIVKFRGRPGVNAFRTSPESRFGLKLRSSINSNFGQDPVVIRIMGGTVPIIPLINALQVPTTIVPMVNMDNNQHNPNENIRVGNIRQGIKICLAILNTKFERSDLNPAD
jgi:acetylornithine deacetylase/succinyl-diaminopimelate desuccinylase-like protein